MKRNRLLTTIALIAAASMLAAGCSPDTAGFKPSIEKIDTEDIPAQTTAGSAQTDEAETQAPAAAEPAAVQEEAAAPAAQDPAPAGEPAAENTDTAAAAASGSFGFEALRNVDFYFSSGAGGWMTELHVKKDGSFYGHYHDSEMGEADDKAPNGSLYYCDFEGWFQGLNKVNDYTYSTTIGGISYANENGTEEIKDGIRYKYTTAYGLDDAGTLYIYLPDAPVKELPEEFVEWVRMAMNYEEREKLGMYGIYNEKAGEGFSGAIPVIDAAFLNIKVQDAQSNSDRLEALLQSDIPQVQLNLYSQELYENWDDLLNDIWGYLKKTLDKETMSRLTDDQVKWINDKEAAVSKEMAQYEGGSIAPLVGNKLAASLTMDRVYELMQYVK